MFLTKKKLLVGAMALLMIVAFMPSQTFAATKLHLGKVTGFKAVNVTQQTTTLKWNKVKKAEEYSVYMKKGSKYKKVKSVDTTKCFITGLKGGQSYSFKVKAHKDYKASADTMKTASSSSKVITIDTKDTVQPIASWNIGGDGTALYTKSTATDSVKATLYDGGTLAVTGSGNTAVFQIKLGKYYPFAPITSKYVPGWISKDAYNAYVKSVTIDTAVEPTNMDNWFAGCSNLKTAPVIPATVTSMHATFSNTRITESPELPAGVIDLSGCYWDVPLTKAPVLPAKVTNLRSAFAFTKITEAPVIPDSVKNMYQTFTGCSKLTTATAIPAGVTNVTSLFEGCKKLTGTVTFMGNPAKYNYCFYTTATASTAKVTVNYSASCTNIDKIIKTKYKSSHVVKGNVL